MTGPQRLHVATLCRELVKYAAQLDYPPGDQRTARDGYSWSLSEHAALSLLERGGRMQFDCSEFVPWVLRCSARWPFTWAGWTGAHLEWWAQRGWTVYTDARAAGIGAIVIFGEGEGHHEAVVTSPSPTSGNPILTSHGEPGLDVVSLRSLAAEQAAAGHPGVRFLAVTKL